jgi:hypothetical protein
MIALASVGAILIPQINQGQVCESRKAFTPYCTTQVSMDLMYWSDIHQVGFTYEILRINIRGSCRYGAGRFCDGKLSHFPVYPPKYSLMISVGNIAI